MNKLIYTALIAANIIAIFAICMLIVFVGVEFGRGLL